MSDLDNSDKGLAGAAPEDEALLDINGNPIPRNWNPGEAPAPADAPPPDAPAPDRPARRPPGPPPRPPGAPQGVRPAYPPRPASPPPPPAAPAYGGMPAEEEEVKYDLAGNALPSDRPTSPPGGPGGYGAMPPPGYTGPRGGGPARPGAGGYGALGVYGSAGGETNTSGMRQGVPPQVAALKWNWAAFLGGTSLWWCFFNGAALWGGILLALALVSWLPFIGVVAGLAYLGVAIYLGLNGHKMAWEGRRFEGGYEQFIGVQRTWLKWAVGLLISGFLALPILVAILFPVYQKIRMQQRSRPYGSGSHRPYGTTLHHARPGYKPGHGTPPAHGTARPH